MELWLVLWAFLLVLLGDLAKFAEILVLKIQLPVTMAIFNQFALSGFARSSPDAAQINVSDPRDEGKMESTSRIDGLTTLQLDFDHSARGRGSLDVLEEVTGGDSFLVEFDKEVGNLLWCIGINCSHGGSVIGRTFGKICGRDQVSRRLHGSHSLKCISFE